MVAFGFLSDCLLFIKLVPGLKKQDTPFSAFQSLSAWCSVIGKDKLF